MFTEPFISSFDAIGANHSGTEFLWPDGATAHCEIVSVGELSATRTKIIGGAFWRSSDQAINDIHAFLLESALVDLAVCRLQRSHHRIQVACHFEPNNVPHHGAAGVDIDVKNGWPPPLPCMRWFAAAVFAKVIR